MGKKAKENGFINVNAKTEALQRFNKAYEFSRIRIFLYILHLVQNKHLAEDIFQDVFTKLWEKFREGKYLDREDYFPLLRRIARSKVIDHFRSTDPLEQSYKELDEQGSKKSEEQDFEELEEQGFGELEEQDLEEPDDIEIMRIALDRTKLSIRKAEMLERYLEGATQKKIAVDMGVTEGTIRNALPRIKSEVRQTREEMIKPGKAA